MQVWRIAKKKARSDVQADASETGDMIGQGVGTTVLTVSGSLVSRPLHMTALPLCSVELIRHPSVPGSLIMKVLGHKWHDSLKLMIRGVVVGVPMANRRIEICGGKTIDRA